MFTSSVKSKHLRWFVVFFLFALWAQVGSKLSATTYQWSGGGTDFADGGSWTANQSPTNDTTSDIGLFSGTVTLNQPALSADRSINGLQFTTSSGGWTLGGAFTLTIGNSGITTNGQTSGTNTISVNLGLATAQTWRVGTGGQLLVSGTISGVSGLTLNDASNTGKLIFSGTNTYTGGTTINGGTLTANNAASLGATSGVLTLNAGTLEIATGFTSARNITLGNTASTFQIDPSQTYTNTGVISSTGALNKTGTGTMVLSGVNTYTGATNVNLGTLQISANERIANTSALTISGGTFAVQTFSETVAGVTLSSGSITGSGAGTLTGSSYILQSGTATAILAGSGTVTKNTGGTVTLSGANTLSGAVTVSAGTLTLATSSGSALGSAASITVNSGGTLLLGASNQINNIASITLGGGTFAKGNFSEGSASTAGAGALTLTATGSHLDLGTGTVGTLTFASFTPGSYSLTIDNWTGTAGTMGSGTTDRLIFDSDQSANLSSFLFTGYTGATEFSLGGGYYEVTPVAAVPEPATYFAGALALGILGYHQRRRLTDRLRRLSASPNP